MRTLCAGDKEKERKKEREKKGLEKNACLCKSLGCKSILEKSKRSIQKCCSRSPPHIIDKGTILDKRKGRREWEEPQDLSIGRVWTYAHGDSWAQIKSRASSINTRSIGTRCPKDTKDISNPPCYKHFQLVYELIVFFLKKECQSKTYWRKKDRG